MTTQQTEKTKPQPTKTDRGGSIPAIGVILCGLAILCLMALVSFYSEQFRQTDSIKEIQNRPICGVVSLLIGCGVVYLVACWLNFYVRRSAAIPLLCWIVGIGLLARAIVVPSTPILEIDLYRYLLDGRVATAGADPFKYAPIEFVQWQYPPENRIAFERSDEELEWIRTFAESQDKSMQEVFSVMTSHFGKYTTPYPPVSQIVFAATDLITPTGSTIKRRITTMKFVLMLFEVATGLVLILILRELKLMETWCIVWFWSPLVMKEFANGGHLDSIATFFCALFVLFCVRQIVRSDNCLRNSIIAGIFLAVAVAAKIYPVVLVPLWAVVTLKKTGLKAVLPGAVSLLTVVVLMLPMLAKVREYRQMQGSQPAAKELSIPKPGILAFTEKWEMNDMIFMVIVENLKASSFDANGQPTQPWFTFTDKDWRKGAEFNVAFNTSRQITMAVFGLIVAYLMVRLTIALLKSPEVDVGIVFVRCVFLTIAWFWLLSPTQNPWYWCWALAFLPFARQKSWLLIGVLCLLYYARFSFESLGSNITDFDFVFPFFEFVPPLVLLLGDLIHDFHGPNGSLPLAGRNLDSLSLASEAK